MQEVRVSLVTNYLKGVYAMNGHMIDVGPVHEMLAVTRAGMSWSAI